MANLKWVRSNIAINYDSFFFVLDVVLGDFLRGVGDFLVVDFLLVEDFFGFVEVRGFFEIEMAGFCDSTLVLDAG